jgi:hypothetical protein
VGCCCVYMLCPRSAYEGWRIRRLKLKFAITVDWPARYNKDQRTPCDLQLKSCQNDFGFAIVFGGV